MLSVQAEYPLFKILRSRGISDFISDFGVSALYTYWFSMSDGKINILNTPTSFLFLFFDLHVSVQRVSDFEALHVLD